MKAAVVLSLLVVMVAPADADIYFDHMEFETDQVPLTWTVAPDGSGPPASGAIRSDGAPWGRDIRVRPWFLTWGGPPDPAPLPGFPAEDVWLESAAGRLVACPGGTAPDGPSDADGWFTWSSPLAAGGGSAPDEAVHMFVGGVRADTPLPLALRSPDIDGDLRVTLADIILFLESLFDAVDPWRADYNADARIDLADIVVMAATLGASCP